MIKGTVSVSLSDPPCKDSNDRFTTVPLKSDKNVESNVGVCFCEFLFCTETPNENKEFK